MLTVLQLPSGDLQSNTWLVFDQQSKESIIFDIGGPNQELEKQIAKHQLIIKEVIITHAHFDHIFGVGTFLANHSDIPIYCPEKDIPIWSQNKMFVKMFGVQVPKDFYEGKLFAIRDGQQFQIGNSSFTAIFTPGHTPGGMCFYNKQAKILISGDTLFGQGVGRTDFPGGSSRDLKNSIKQLQQKVDKDAIVYSGHGGAEKFSKSIKYAYMMVNEDI